MKNSHTFKSPISLFTLLVSLIFLTACFHDDDNPVAGPVPDADPIGYYEGFATIGVAAGDLVIASSDLQAIVDADTFTIVNVANKLVYAGTFTDITDKTYTATLRVYKDGYFVRTADVSGDITGRSFIHGTITGTGDYASGSFELTYHDINSRGAMAFGASDIWGINTEAGILDITKTAFNLILVGTIAPTELGGCDANGNALVAINGEQAGRLWRFTTSGLVGCGNDNTNDGRILDGFLTKFDLVTADDRVLFVFYDDTYAYTGQLPLQ